MKSKWKVGVRVANGKRLVHCKGELGALRGGSWGGKPGVGRNGAESPGALAERGWTDRGGKGAGLCRGQRRRSEVLPSARLARGFAGLEGLRARRGQSAGRREEAGSGWAEA